MLSKNIFKYRSSRKLLPKFKYILTITIFLLSIFLNFANVNVQAAQYTEIYTDNFLDSYVGYSTLISELKNAHPNWSFTILHTGLDWNQVIKNETTVTHGRNLITGSKTGEWVCSKCGADRYDNGSWKCASEATVSYYMDPRNSLFEDYIFQFEDLRWVEGVYTLDGINKILSDCKYLQGDSITYTATDGTSQAINKSYAQIIYDAGKENNISPYHLAARIRQEQGPGTAASSTATGTYSNYNGYYNFFNVNATGSGSSTIIKNALEHAKSKDWTDPEKSIIGGAAFVANEYINDGQSTLYLQKFDVDSSDGSLYWHQYMQNVSASKTEGGTILKTYKAIDENLNQNFNFIIPVYENMPDTRCPQPGFQTIVTQNIEVTDEKIEIKSSKDSSSSTIATLNQGDKLLRIEISNLEENGYYWDKVVLDDGTKGYIISSGFKVLEDITNCNIRAIATDTGNVRNGPGTKGTVVITTLTIGQSITIMEKGKYINIDGENWSRIYLSDGRQGYIVARFLEEFKHDNGLVDSGKEVVKVICKSGLSVRGEPGTDKKILKYTEKGDYLTRIEKAVSNTNGYVWDKIITDDGIEGYIARGDKDEEYIQLVTNEAPTINGNGVKTSGTNILCEPNMTVEALQNIEKDIIIKDNKENEVLSGDIGTGFTIKYNGQTYTVIKLADVNGDGKVNTGDTLVIKQHVGKVEYMQDSNYLKAADVNKDGNINSGDSLVAKQHVGKVKNITIE